MAQAVRDVMTADPRTVPAGASVADAARAMKEQDVGPMIVTDHDGTVYGLVTDRDITIRAVAEDRDVKATAVSEICSKDLTTVEQDLDVDDAVRIMRQKALRRLPVVNAGRPVGIVSLGDLAMDKDPGSALADISSAPPNR